MMRGTHSRSRRHGGTVAKKKASKRKRCLCGGPLHADGRCFYNCPPGGAHKAQRETVKAQRAAEKRAVKRIGFTKTEREAIARTSAIDGDLGARYRASARRGGFNSHKWGARR